MFLYKALGVLGLNGCFVVLCDTFYKGGVFAYKGFYNGERFIKDL